MAERVQLNKSARVTLSAAGAGTVTLGPSSSKGPAGWNVTRFGVANVNTARRGVPPIPTCSVYVDTESLDNLVDGTYDGSFDFADCDVDLQRGQNLLAVFAGGQAGDAMVLTVTAWKQGT